MTGVRYLPLDKSPDLEHLARCYPDRYPYLLKSVSNNDPRSDSVDILFARSTGELRLCRGADGWQLHTCGEVPDIVGSDFLHGLDVWFKALGPAPESDRSLPFRGGWFVYLGYELAGQVEPDLSAPFNADETVALAARVPVAVISIRGSNPRSLVVVEPGYDSLGSEVFDDCILPANIFDDHGVASAAVTSAGASNNAIALNEDSPSRFIGAVKHALDYIANGDIYQANLSRRWYGPIGDADVSSLFAALNRSNPAPFSALARLGDLCIVSSSPERLVQVSGRSVSTRPIAGTRPRGSDAHEDRRLLEELRANPKEQAEHVMLIDLERNDLGRICRAGSVHVDEYMGIESYAFVHHIVSNIAGELRDDVLPGDVIRAVFPGGTITGCPKFRCMQIIAQLEDEPRSAYTGSLGYLNRDGDMDLNILIRTLMLANGELSFRTGAGIVADSNPAAELEETRAKAEGLLRALKAPMTCSG